ncbi:MAG: NAD(P)-dependent oxidoreductase, partial [Rhodospirillales bacterium]
TVYGISRTNREIEGIDKVFSRDDLTEAVKDVDFLIALVPFNPETHNIIDARVFYAMKPSACLINVARGGVVDEAALIDALKNGEISGAGLDVFEESPLPDNSPLWDMENVFITPFTGGRSDKYAERILTVIEPNIRAYLDGTTKYMKNIVQF